MVDDAQAVGCWIALRLLLWGVTTLVKLFMSNLSASVIKYQWSCIAVMLCVYSMVVVYCWLGLLTCKNCRRITYNVLVETLNHALSIYLCILQGV